MRRVDPYSVKCPYCEQAVQRVCVILDRERMFNGFRKHPHPARVKLARERASISGKGK